jgi:predicted PurR-regulated permease PerM
MIPYDSGMPFSGPGMRGTPEPPAKVPPNPPKTLWLDWRSAAWVGGGVFSALVIVGFLRNVPDSMTRVGIGVLLAFALDPIVTKVRHRLRCTRETAVALVGTTTAVIFLGLVLLVGPPALRQAREFGRELPQTVEDLYDIPIAGNWLEDADAAEKVREWAANLPARIDTDSVTQTAKNLLDGVVAGMVVVLVGVAVLVDGERLVARLRAAIPKRIEPRAVEVGQIFYRTIGAYFSGSLLVAALAATFILIVGLILGIPLAPAAALWMLLVNLIPQIGGLLGGGFFVILALSESVTKGLICLVLFLVYQQIENHLIQPAIVGQAVDLSAPATMLAALIGGAAAGVPGALVATPLVGVAKALYMELRWGQVPDQKPPPLSILERIRSSSILTRIRLRLR